jgi:hypothetical protein
MNDTIRSALITVIKSHRQKMSHAQRQRGVKPQRWLYPYATEARYAATIRAWLRPMKDYVHSYLKENAEVVMRGDSADFTTDSVDSLSATRLDAVPGKSFKRMIDSLNGWLGQYVPDDDESKSGSPIYMGLGKTADSTFGFNEGQYEKGAKTVLGVEFPVGEDWWPNARDTWRQQNYDTIQGDMKKYIGQINALTEKAVTSGLSVKELAKQIAALDDKLKGRANFIARDQIGKLNGEITQRRMESVGLTMYIWETSGDERVRGDPGGKYPNAKPSHWLMDGALCRWDDSTVYSQDGGKTWIPRPSGAVTQHPGMDYLCRCTAIAEWNELVGEADELIAQYEELDALSAQNIAAMPKTTSLPLAATRSATLKRQQRERNAKKAKEAADKLFPGEKWKPVEGEERIYLSLRRPVGKKSNYKDELRDAQILRDMGNTVYLTSENRGDPGKKYDAIVNGERFEFKNMKGGAESLKTHFLRSRSQAPNVFIDLEESNLTKSQVITALYGARNSPEYGAYNRFKGGKIILKIKGQINLTYLSVDGLKISSE